MLPTAARSQYSGRWAQRLRFVLSCQPCLLCFSLVEENKCPIWCLKPADLEVESLNYVACFQLNLLSVWTSECNTPRFGLLQTSFKGMSILFNINNNDDNNNISLIFLFLLNFTASTTTFYYLLYYYPKTYYRLRIPVFQVKTKSQQWQVVTY